MIARLRGPDGREETCEAGYIAGCDGARSIVRETIGTGFPGGTYRQVFYVADVEAAGPPLNGELHVDLDEADFLGVFPLAGEGRARLIGTVRDERADRAETLNIRGRQRSGDQPPQGRRPGSELVLDLSRPSPRGGAFPQRPRVPAWRCGAYPQPGRRPRDEHRDRRRNQSGLEAGGGSRPAARPTGCSTATRRNGSALPGGWSRPPIACSASSPPRVGSPTSFVRALRPC